MLRLACHAMGTRFELLLVGSDEQQLHSIGQEALGEIQALERQLSRFSPSSEISRINRNAFQRPVRTEPQLFALLQRCRRFWERTGGAFDPTAGPLLQAWGWDRKSGRIPSSSVLQGALAQVGMDKVELDADQRRVRFLSRGMSFDLGAVGKGYALDRAALILREHGLSQALLHGGTSSILALGAGPSGEAWRIGVADPRSPDLSLAQLQLKDEAIGVSGQHLQSLQAGDASIGHIIDPRSGRPADGLLLAASRCASACEADALSTAFLCLGFDSEEAARPCNPVLAAWEEEGQVRTWSSN